MREISQTEYFWITIVIILELIAFYISIHK